MSKPFDEKIEEKQPELIADELKEGAVPVEEGVRLGEQDADTNIDLTAVLSKTETSQSVKAIFSSQGSGPSGENIFTAVQERLIGQTFDGKYEILRVSS